MEKDCFENYDYDSKICKDGCFKRPECLKATRKKQKEKNTLNEDGK
jgi:hypothetical protein